MRYPKTAVLFEGLVDSRYDGCVVGKIYEFSEPAFGSTNEPVIWAVDAFAGQPSNPCQHALVVSHLKPLTEAARKLVKNMPRKVRNLADAIEVAVG